MKKIVILLTTLCLMSIQAMPINAINTYENYVYTSNSKYPQAEPSAYLPTKIINAYSLNTTKFSDPQDICVSSDTNKIYVSDSGNNRILVLNKSCELIKTMKDFSIANVKNEFNNPTGLFVSKDNLLYVCDTNNKRILVFDQNENFVLEYKEPKSLLLKNEFKPIKVAVDFSNRLYVILKDENGGFVQLEKDGTFSGFFGATLTKPSIADAFSKLISTKEQRLRTQRAVPTRYSGVTIDNSGFVFGTIGNANLTSGFDPNNFVRKLNPSGNDILKRNGIIPIFGDSDMLEVEGKKVFSDLCDIVALPSGIFSVLGQQYGRIYTYNGSGDLMFVFGGLGDSKGQFGLPVALDVIDNNKYLVLDNKYNQILLFEPTEYALAVTKATILYENREYDKAKELWETVLKYTTKSELAFTGVGKSLLRDGEYSKAMEYFYLSNNKGFFSEAYKNYRKDVMKKNFGIYMSVILVLIILFVIGIKIYKKTKRVKDYA